MGACVAKPSAVVKQSEDEALPTCTACRMREDGLCRECKAARGADIEEEDAELDAVEVFQTDEGDESLYMVDGVQFAEGVSREPDYIQSSGSKVVLLPKLPRGQRRRVWGEEFGEDGEDLVDLGLAQGQGQDTDNEFEEAPQPAADHDRNANAHGFDLRSAGILRSDVEEYNEI